MSINGELRAQRVQLVCAEVGEFLDDFGEDVGARLLAVDVDDEVHFAIFGDDGEGFGVEFS